MGTPAIFGMNFQTVSTAQKLPTSDGLKGGYEADGVTPGPLLRRALDYINAQVEAMVDTIHQQGLTGSTTIIISAKHGQSPQTPSALTRIPDGPILSAMDAAWAALHPSDTQPLVVQSTDDDGMLLWLSDRSVAATTFAKNFLLDYSGTGNDINGAPKAFTQSGLTQVYAGAEAAGYFNVPVNDPRVPDVFGIAQYGVVFTGGQAKIAEHGGANFQDRNVPILISGAGIHGHAVVNTPLETTEIAPTILSLLGLDPNALQAVDIEHTPTLPIDH
jgi:arylsulfatase A-like enzyme